MSQHKNNNRKGELTTKITHRANPASVQPTPSTKLSTKQFMLLGLVVLLLLVCFISHNNIINYPVFLYWITGGVVFAGFFIYLIAPFIKEFKNCNRAFDKASAMFVFICELLTATLLGGCILLTPFNYYDKYACKTNPEEINTCNIEQVIGRRATKSIYFLFKGELNLVHGTGNMTKEMYSAKDYNNYSITVKTRQGLFGSFIIDDWYIERK